MKPQTRRFTIIPSSPEFKTTTHFHHLPIEIQAEIFVHCLPDSPRFGFGAPDLLLQVCPTWRGIAISTPRLWTSLNVDLDDSVWRPSYEQRILALVSLWLSRSKSLPLTVALTYRPSTGSHQRHFEGTARSLLVTLLQSCSRWHALTLVLPGPCLSPLLQATPPDLPLLRSLSLESKGPWTSVPSQVQTLGLNWAQLSTLDLWFDYDSLFTLDEWAYILGETQGLIHCRFNAKCAWREPQSKLKDAPLGLETLEIMFQGETDVPSPSSALASFLEHLDLPSLSECRLFWQVRHRVVAGNIISGALQKFLAPLGQSLKGLSLAYFPLEDRTLIECLAVLRVLEDIRLQYSLQDSRTDAGLSPITDRVMQAFTLSPVLHRRAMPLQTGILPRLRSIQFHCHASAFSGEALAQMIESRKRTDLRSVSCLSLKSPEHSRALLDKMESWKEANISVTMDLVEL